MSGVDDHSPSWIDAVLRNRYLLVLRAMASLSGLSTFLYPDAGPAIRSIAWILTGIALLSFAYQAARSTLYRFQDEIAYQIGAHKFGYGYTALRIRAYLDAEGGGMRSHRRVRLKTTAVQSHIRHYLRSLGTDLKDSVAVVGCHFMKPDGTVITATRVPALSQPSGLVIDVQFNPALEEGDSAYYEVQEQFPDGSFATTAEELTKMGLEHEYMAWHIDKPTKHVRLEVFVPNSLNPVDVGYEVWYGIYSQQTHAAERDRLSSYFHIDDYGEYTVLELEIPYPVLGLDYVIRWKYR
jgi:hypothetical protein